MVFYPIDSVHHSGDEKIINHKAQHNQGSEKFGQARTKQLLLTVRAILASRALHHSVDTVKTKDMTARDLRARVFCVIIAPTDTAPIVVELVVRLGRHDMLLDEGSLRR
jgi:hypothetical protein